MNKMLGAALSLIGSADRARALASHDYEDVFLKLRARLEELLDGPLAPQTRLLDLGCGYAYPNVALFDAVHLDVVGADVESVFFRDGRLATFKQRLRERGFAPAILCAGPRYTEYGQYFSELERLARTNFDHRSLSVNSYDGHRLPFANETFDVVFSNAVLEHVEDLPAFVEETARVLRPEGVIDMLWHNFYSPSGGHRWGRDEEKSPWGHITGESPATCYLNEKKPDEVRAEFERRFSVRRVVGAGKDQSLEGDPGFVAEGAGRLDMGWRAKLPGLSDHLLTTRSFLIQAVKGR